MIALAAFGLVVGKVVGSINVETSEELSKLQLTLIKEKMTSEMTVFQILESFKLILNIPAGNISESRRCELREFYHIPRGFFRSEGNLML